MSTHKRPFTLFSVPTEVIGAGLEPDHLARVLSAVSAESSGHSEPQVVFDFSNVQALGGTEIKAGEVRFGPNFVEFLSPTHRVVLEKTDRIRISLAKRSRRKATGLRLREIYRAARQFGSLDPDEAHRSRLLSYANIWGPYAIALLTRAKALFHAGCADVGGKGVLIVGAGGSGKSSVTLELVGSAAGRYLSEDFCIVDRDVAYLSPRPLPVYAEDIARGNRILVRWWTEHLSAMEKLVWRWAVHARQNPRRMVPPREMFMAEEISLSVPIHAAVVLMRGNFQEIRVRPIDIEDFTQRALGVTFRELFNMRDLLFYGDYLRSKDGFDVSYIGSSTALRALYTSYLKDKRLAIVEIPFASAPRRIADSILKLLP